MDIYVIIGNIGYFITFLELSYMSDRKWDACDSPTLNHLLYMFAYRKTPI